MTRILGIDYGKVRIGIALSDVLGLTAQPLDVIERRSLEDDISKIKDLVDTYNVIKIVIGLPINMDGSKGDSYNEVVLFAEKIKERISIPIDFYDERLTTVRSERFLTEEADISREKRKGLRDKIAAAIMLQDYLDAKM